MTEHAADHQHSKEIDPTEVRFTEEFWDERYGSAPSIWSGKVNRHWSPRPTRSARAMRWTSAVERAPTRSGWPAADGGCWRSTGRPLRWNEPPGTPQTNLLVTRSPGSNRIWSAGIPVRIASIWCPVSTFTYRQPNGTRCSSGWRRRSVLGGTLLIVGHHPHDLQTSMPRPDHPDLFYTGDQIAALLDPEAWTVVTNEAVGREVQDPDGVTITIEDAVFRAERRV